MSDPFKVVREFEAQLCEYTGAPYAVTVNSCTMAILLALAWRIGKHRVRAGNARFWVEWPARPLVGIPKRTYISVPMCIVHAGGRPTFRDEDWTGAYQLTPLPVWDCARRFTSSMYVPGQFQCVSFHTQKILGHNQGGAILHDNAEADAWLRRARFDGRTEGVAPKDDKIDMIGWHCYLSPDVAASLILKLHWLPRHNEDLPADEYPDLSTMEIFR